MKNDEIELQVGRVQCLPAGFTVQQPSDRESLERALVLLYSLRRLDEEQVAALLGGPCSVIDLERMRARVVKDAQVRVVTETMKNGDSVTFGVGNGFRKIPDVSDYRAMVLVFAFLAAVAGSFVGYIFGSC